jgi:hypothetical protein
MIYKVRAKEPRSAIGWVKPKKDRDLRFGVTGKVFEFVPLLHHVKVIYEGL